MKYRAKRDFLGVTKGMEFQADAVGDICIPTKIKASNNVCWIDPTQYPNDFELIEEPKYTDSDLDDITDIFYKYWVTDGSTAERSLKKAIAELKQSKDKK